MPVPTFANDQDMIAAIRASTLAKLQPALRADLQGLSPVDRTNRLIGEALDECIAPPVHTYYWDRFAQVVMRVLAEAGLPTA